MNIGLYEITYLKIVKRLIFLHTQKHIVWLLFSLGILTSAKIIRIHNPQCNRTKIYRRASWLKGILYEVLLFQFSEDEEDTKRVVRSAKEKRYEEIKNNIKSIKNYKSIRDLYSVLSSKFPFVVVWSSDSNLFRFQPKNFKCIVTHEVYKSVKTGY